MFIDFAKLDWSKALIVIGAATTFWTLLVSIVPEKYHHAGMVILGAASAAVTYIMKAEKQGQ